MAPIDYLSDPTDPDVAKAYFAEELKEPGAKLFRVKLNGPIGVTFDAILLSKSQDEAIGMAVEKMGQLQGNDFDKDVKEVPV
jgi:hypothetical protein